MKKLPDKRLKPFTRQLSLNKTLYDIQENQLSFKIRITISKASLVAYLHSSNPSNSMDCLKIKPVVLDACCDSVRFYDISAYFTIKTGILARCTTLWLTLPKINSRIGPSPRLPITIKS